MLGKIIPVCKKKKRELFLLSCANHVLFSKSEHKYFKYISVEMKNRYKIQSDGKNDNIKEKQ